MSALRLTTFLARNPTVLERQLRQIADSYAKTGTDVACLFSLSASEDVDWTACWTQLRRIGGDNGTVGCISSPLKNVVGGISLMNSPMATCKKARLDSYLTCSIGIFPASTVVPFRSRILGNEQPQVGRWHAFRKHREVAPWDESLGEPTVASEVNWEAVWSKGKEEAAVPLDEFGDVRPEEIQSFVYFTDRAYQGLTRSLTKFYPGATKLGLVAPSTLTINECPATMMYGGTILSEGAVGLGIRKSPSLRAAASHFDWTPTSTLDFQGVYAICEEMQVTASNGNVIETINNSNPTQLLLGALEACSTSRATTSNTATTPTNPSVSPMLRFLNERIFLGVIQPQPERISRMYQISAGDPSRGPLSIMAERAPGPGEVVKFFLRPDTDPILLPSLLETSLQSQSPDRNWVEFATLCEMHDFPSVTPSEPKSNQTGEKEGDGGEEELYILEGRFISGSDAGIVFHHGEGGVESTTPGEEANVASGGPVGSLARLSIQL